MTPIAHSSLRDYSLKYYQYAKDRAFELYQKASEPGDTQKKVLAIARAGIGIIAINNAPLSAFVGAVAAANMPGKADAVTSALDGILTELWNYMNFNTKMFVCASGSLIAISPIGSYIIAAPCTVIAAKIGAEFALSNLQKSQEHKNNEEPVIPEKRVLYWKNRIISLFKMSSK